MIKKAAAVLDSAWAWLVTSSVNPSAVALTVKGALATGIAYVIGFVGLVHVQVPGLSDELNGISDQIVLFVQYALGTVGAVSTVVGLIRKLIISFHSISAVPPASS